MLVHKSPVGMVNQATINARGEIVMKDRVNHKQLMGAISSDSINDYIIYEELAQLRYGHILSRLMYQIVVMMEIHLNKGILLRKDDFKSANR